MTQSDTINDNVAQQASAALVDFLRTQLAMAETGELRGVVLVTNLANGNSGFWLVGQVGGFTMQGAIDVAKHAITKINMPESV